LQCLLFQIDEAQIVVHEADDPDAFLDLIDAKFLTGKDVGVADALAVQQSASARIKARTRGEPRSLAPRSFIWEVDQDPTSVRPPR